MKFNDIEIGTKFKFNTGGHTWKKIAEDCVESLDGTTAGYQYGVADIDRAIELIIISGGEKKNDIILKEAD